MSWRWCRRSPWRYVRRRSRPVAVRRCVHTAGRARRSRLGRSGSCAARPRGAVSSILADRLLHIGAARGLVLRAGACLVLAPAGRRAGVRLLLRCGVPSIWRLRGCWFCVRAGVAISAHLGDLALLEPLDKLAPLAGPTYSRRPRSGQVCVSEKENAPHSVRGI